jgi:hypothetical protein
MAFVDVLLDDAVDGQSLALEASVPPDIAPDIAPVDGGEFHVQILLLADGRTGARSPGDLPQVIGEAFAGELGADGRLVYRLPAVRTAAANRLGVIITRIDAGGMPDAAVECTIAVRVGG